VLVYKKPWLKVGMMSKQSSKKRKQAKTTFSGKANELIKYSDQWTERFLPRVPDMFLGKETIEKVQSKPE
jgi:hypothetical protein